MKGLRIENVKICEYEWKYRQSVRQQWRSVIVGSTDRELTQDRNGRIHLHEQDNDTIKMAAAIGATTEIL